MQKAKYLILFFISLLHYLASAQDTGNFTQFFFNPYSLNPSFAGIDGRGALFLSYRKQWSGIQGGPSIANVSFHTPLKSSGLSFGINAANDQRGILSKSGMLMTMAYSISLGEHNYLRFGLSGGGSWNTIDLDKIQNLGTDPALANILGQNASVIGNAGISLHLKSFHIGAAIPNIFSPAFVSKDAFTITDVRPFEAFVVHASNRFYFSKGKHIFEPYAVYRLNTGLPSQYEVAGVLHLNHVVWMGGSFKQDFGVSALGGIKLNKRFALGGSYTIKNSGINELSFPTYEVHLSLLGGPTNAKNKKKNAVAPSAYSFVDTELPKLTKTQEQNEKYHAAIAKADKALAAKRYDEAKADYQEALKYKPNENYPKTKITEADKFITYEADIKKANAELSSKSYEQALADYETASALLPNEHYPKEKIAEIKALIAKENESKELDKKYQEAIARADAAFQANDYVTAKKLYTEALTIKSTEKYPQEELKEIERLMARAVKSEKEPVKVVTKEPVKEPVKEPAKEVVKEPAKEPLKEPAKEPVKEPMKEVVKEPIKEVVKELPKEPVERHETITRGKHPQELNAGNYVIVGVFGSGPNAKNMARKLVDTGFNANYGYLSEKNLWYVHIWSGDDINKTRTERDRYRKMPMFPNAWLLTVEN